MRETFAEFRARHTVGRKNAEKIRTDSAREWERVRGSIEALAGVEAVDGHAFQWVNGLSFLALQDVCAGISDARPFTGTAQRYTVRFNRRPSGPGEMFGDDSPIGPEDWFVGAVIENGQFLWNIETPSGYRVGLNLSADEVADEVAKGLAEYFLKYEAAYGR